MRAKSREQIAIDRKNSERKKELLIKDPRCIFCGRRVGGSADLAHKVRRSWASKYHSRYELHTMALNNGLAHRDCHEIFDNDREVAKTLPRYSQILEDIKEIDVDYYNMIITEW